MDFLTPQILTPSILLMLVVYFVMTGKLVPRQVLEDEKARGNEWKEAYRLSEDARQKQSVVIAEMTETTRTANLLIKTLRDVFDSTEEEALDAESRK